MSSPPAQHCEERKCFDCSTWRVEQIVGDFSPCPTKRRAVLSTSSDAVLHPSRSKSPGWGRRQGDRRDQRELPVELPNSLLINDVIIHPKRTLPCLQNLRRLPKARHLLLVYVTRTKQTCSPTKRRMPRSEEISFGSQAWCNLLCFRASGRASSEEPGG
eukprot:758913-Hanusia_phi.AAC.4